MREMSMVEMQEVNGGGFGVALLIACGLAIFIGAKVLPAWAEAQVKKYKKKYGIK